MDTFHLQPQKILVIYLVVLSDLVSCYLQNFGIIHAQVKDTPNNYGQYCMIFNPRFQELPDNFQDAHLSRLVDITEETYSELCEDEQDLPDFAHATVALNRGNCTFSEKAQVVQSHDGIAALVISSTGLHEPGANSTHDYDEINITVAVMDASDFKHIQALGKEVEVRMYAPPTPVLDYNVLLIWVLAVGTVAIGSFWSGHAKQRQFLRKKFSQSPRDGSAINSNDTEQDEPEALDVSPKFVLLFVILMCGMLVSLYFFYDYLVYVIIGLFAMASSVALYSILKPLVRRCICPCTSCRLPENNLPLLSKRPDIRFVILALVCIGIGVWWIIVRNESYAWILQDILGVLFCIHMMKTIRLPNFKVCFILLALLFLYDVFFVFITPLITQTGQSVMVEVATGGDSDSGEMLPMVLKVPRFTNSILSVCTLPYSLLGFGDILVPGLLISYCHWFDLKVKSRRIYFIANVIAYGIGLVLTFVALALMEKGQPALLYLVPCTVLTTILIACCRGEFLHLWRGEEAVKLTVPKKETRVEEPRVAPGQDQLPVPTSVGVNHGSSDLESSSVEGEDQHLIDRQ